MSAMTPISAMPAATTRPVNRRSFLRNLGVLGAGISLSSLPLGFAEAAAAQTGGERSLVCVFLAGGADSFNMFVPRDHQEAGQTHATYSSTRGAFAVPANQLLPVGDGAFGLHPQLSALAGISGSGRLATIANVGPLARPTSRTDVLERRSIPQSLFAHDAQQKLWQTGRSGLADDMGWGGSIAAAVANGSEVPGAFSINGSNIWQNSAVAAAARLSPTVRIERLLGYDASLRSWIPSFGGVEAVLHGALQSADRSSNAFDQVAANNVRQSITTTSVLQEATAASEANDVGMTGIGANRLALQLQQVARLIKNRDALGMPRQVFFVRMGGWDTHRVQQQLFPVLLGQLDQALGSFQTALDDLGVAESVTTFTASDFGRTLTINGDGTDHGWGGHAFVMGGAVNEGLYGTFPSYSTSNNPDDVTENSSDFAGRLIPTTSVAQYGATLSRWMGLSDPQLNSAFPELENFTSNDLGFLSS